MVRRSSPDADERATAARRSLPPAAARERRSGARGGLFLLLERGERLVLRLRRSPSRRGCLVTWLSDSARRLLDPRGVLVDADHDQRGLARRWRLAGPSPSRRCATMPWAMLPDPRAPTPAPIAPTGYRMNSGGNRTAAPGAGSRGRSIRRCLTGFSLLVHLDLAAHALGEHGRVRRSRRRRCRAAP